MSSSAVKLLRSVPRPYADSTESARSSTVRETAEAVWEAVLEPAMLPPLVMLIASLPFTPLA